MGSEQSVGPHMRAYPGWCFWSRGTQQLCHDHQSDKEEGVQAGMKQGSQPQNHVLHSSTALVSVMQTSLTGRDRSSMLISIFQKHVGVSQKQITEKGWIWATPQNFLLVWHCEEPMRSNESVKICCMGSPCPTCSCDTRATSCTLADIHVLPV